MGERPPFVDGSRARNIAPSFNDMMGVLVQPDIAANDAPRTGHTCRPASLHHGGGSNDYFRPPRGASIPLIETPQPGGLRHKVFELIKPLIRR